MCIPGPFGARRSAGAHGARAQAVHQLAIIRRQAVEQAIDRFDDNAPLGEPCDGAEGVQAGLHICGNPNTELGVVLHLLAVFRACRGAPGTASTNDRALISRHGDQALARDSGAPVRVSAGIKRAPGRNASKNPIDRVIANEVQLFLFSCTIGDAFCNRTTL